MNRTSPELVPRNRGAQPLQNTLSNLPGEFNGLVFVRYLDHVQYNRTSALAMAPQTRETVGWLIYECQEYITLSWDRDSGPATLHGGDPKATGMCLLKSDILEFKRLKTHAQPPKENKSHILNAQPTICENEFALQTKERKTHGRNKGETST
jgi:hypothetical protein